MGGSQSQQFRSEREKEIRDRKGKANEVAKENRYAHFKGGVAYKFVAYICVLACDDSDADTIVLQQKEESRVLLRTARKCASQFPSHAHSDMSDAHSMARKSVRITKKDS